MHKNYGGTFDGVRNHHIIVDDIFTQKCVCTRVVLIVMTLLVMGLLKDKICEVICQWRCCYRTKGNYLHKNIRIKLHCYVVFLFLFFSIRYIFPHNLIEPRIYLDLLEFRHKKCHGEWWYPHWYSCLKYYQIYSLQHFSIYKILVDWFKHRGNYSVKPGSVYGLHMYVYCVDVEMKNDGRKSVW